MGAVDHYGRRLAALATAALGHKVAHVIHRGEDQASVGRQHQVVHATTSLFTGKKDVFCYTYWLIITRELV